MTATMAPTAHSRRMLTVICRAMATVHNQKSMRRLLEAHGWVRTIGGKHVVKMTKPGQRPITLPMHKGQDYGPALTASILRQAGLS
jgi:predicted RNA binding protein YcfA (HicA-like mRNA interferase family)